MQIIHGPQEFNFSKSFPDIELTASNQITINLKFIGLAKEIIERYDPAPLNSSIKIKLSEIIDSILLPTRPVFMQLITRDSTIIDRVQITMNDGNSSQVDICEVIRGYVRHQPFDVSVFLSTNFLNLVPGTSIVYFHQPICLTVFNNQANCQIMVKAMMKSGLEKVVSLGILENRYVQHIYINPGQLIYTLGGEYEYFEVFTLKENIIQHGYKKFYYGGEYPFSADVFFYANRLGGWDTIVLTGERTDTHDVEISSALFSDIEQEYDQLNSYSIEKTSGYISSEEYARQCIDFLQSSERYHLQEGEFHKIVLSNTSIKRTKGKLDSFTFTFKHSDRKMAYPEIGVSLFNLNIK